MHVIFTSLGPDKKYTTTDGRVFEDADVGVLEGEDLEVAVIQSKFAQEYTEDLETKTKRLVASAKKKRAEILLKMEKMKQNKIKR